MSKIINVRVTEEELLQIEEKAKANHLSRSEYTRRVMLHEAERQSNINSDEALRILIKMQFDIEAKSRKHKNMDFSVLNKDMEELAYVLCERS